MIQEHAWFRVKPGPQTRTCLEARASEPRNAADGEAVAPSWRAEPLCLFRDTSVPPAVTLILTAFTLTRTTTRNGTVWNSVFRVSVRYFWQAVCRAILWLGPGPRLCTKKLESSSPIQLLIALGSKIILDSDQSRPGCLAAVPLTTQVHLARLSTPSTLTILALYRSVRAVVGPA